MHVPLGTTVEVDLASADVIHSFWIPRLAGKQDVVPNQHNHLSFTANEVGTFTGQCAEFCGIEHAEMRFEVVVDSQSDFDAWVKQMQQTANNQNLINWRNKASRSSSRPDAPAAILSMAPNTTARRRRATSVRT